MHEGCERDIFGDISQIIFLQYFQCYFFVMLDNFFQIMFIVLVVLDKDGGGVENDCEIFSIGDIDTKMQFFNNKDSFSFDHPFSGWKFISCKNDSILCIGFSDIILEYSCDLLIDQSIEG